MNIPFPLYLNAINQSLAPNSSSAAEPPPPPFGAFSGAPGFVPPAPTGPAPVPYDPAGQVSTLSSQGPAPAPPPPPAAVVGTPGVNMSGPPPPAPAPAPAHAPADIGPPRPGLPGGMPFPLVRAGGGGVVNVPAKETELRGPTFLGAQGQANAATERAIEHVNERSLAAADQEYLGALHAEQSAYARQDAAMASAAQREQELQERQQDFDQSVAALSKMSVDPGRFWASQSTAGKIGAGISLILGGMLSARNGGPNQGLEFLNTQIDRDMKAQEFAFSAARSAAEQKQTAFGLAMQKYNNVDAARAAARAAALDAVQGQIGRQAALWKGTDAQNRADMAMAALADQKAQQIAQGIMFAPARQVATAAQYVDPTTGMVYNEAQAHELAKELRGYGFESGKIQAQTAGRLEEKRMELAGKGSKETDEGAKFIADKLQTAGIPQARSAAELALRALNTSEGGAVEATFRGVVPGAVASKVLSDESNAREQSFAAYKNAAMKAMMGNVTESELARAEAQFGQAHDPKSRKRAIETSLEILKSAEKNIKAGATPEGQREFERREQNANGAPAAAPAGAKPGW